MSPIQVRRFFTRRASKDSEPPSPETLRPRYALDPSSSILPPYSEANRTEDMTWNTHIEAHIPLPAQSSEIQLSRSTSITDGSSRYDARSSTSSNAPQYSMLTTIQRIVYMSSNSPPVYYRVYGEHGAIQPRTRFDSDDLSIGRIKAVCISPLCPVSTLKSILSKAEYLNVGVAMLLYRDASYSSPLPNDRVLSFSTELGPGRSIEEPLALKLLPAETERRFTVALIAKYAGEISELL